jgi:hypothetical protein
MPMLTVTGRTAELEAVHERLYRIWPRSASALYNRFYNNLYQGRYAESLKMMDTREVPENANFRRYMEAGVRGDDAGRRAAVAEVAAAARAGNNPLSQAIALAATFGDVDTAFELADRLYGDADGDVVLEQPVGGAARFLPFLISTRKMWPDPRYFPLLERLGLMAYWRQTGRWPDLCKDPSLASRCR